VATARQRTVIHHGLVGDDDDGAIGWIREIVLDSDDPWSLASFWAGLLGGTPVEWYRGWVTLEPPPHGQRLSFQGTGTEGQPAAAGEAGPIMHFDVLVRDLPAAHERVVAAGAAVVGEHLSPRPGPGGELIRWRVYRDPAGHPFCLVTR
jgi:predicted enzyme related to lactoylglutathione lyase